MFIKYYQKAKKHGKRAVPFVMAAIMLLQTGMGNVVLASEEPGDISQIETESEAALPEEEPQTTVQQEETTEPSNETVGQDVIVDPEIEMENLHTDVTMEEKTARDAINWTQYTESFTLSADKVVYQEKGGTQTTVKNVEGRIDLSALMAETMENQNLFVRFAFHQAAMTEQLQAGDYFAFTVPKEYMILADTSEPAEAFVCNQQAYEEEPSAVVDREMIGTYEIRDNVVTLTVTEVPPSGNLFGVLDLSFQWNGQNITAEGTACNLDFLNGAAAQVQLPKKAAELETDKGQQTKAADKTAVQNGDAGAAKKPEGTKTEETGKDEDATILNGRTDAQDDTKNDGNPVKRFFRSIVNFFTNQDGAQQDYAGGTTSSHLFEKDDLPDGFSQVKVTVYNKNGGYTQEDNPKVRFKFNMILDEDYLYSTMENNIMIRADYPMQGNTPDEEYEKKIGDYLNNLVEKGELTSLDYDYNLGEKFSDFNIEEPITLYDATGFACGKYSIENGDVKFHFYGSCYFYDDIVATINVEADLNQSAVSDKPIDVVFASNGELISQSTGTGGGGGGDTEDKNYYIQKEAAARVSNPEITYTITAGALGDTLLNGLQIVDALPEGLELKSVTYKDKELAAGKDYIYNSSTRTFTYTFEPLNESKNNKVTTAEFTIAAKLSDTRYQDVIKAGGINETFKNTAKLKEKGKDEPLAVSDEVSTNMKFEFFQKEGQEEQLNGARYSWTIAANTQLPYLDHGYLVDTLCWTDHQYDFEQGITVQTKNGTTVYNKTDIRFVQTGPAWEELTVEKLDVLKAESDGKPFYYLYDTVTENPFKDASEEPQYKQMAVLVLPFDAADGWTGTQTQQTLRVKYFTDLNLHGLSMDEYMEKVKDNEEMNPKITNLATLLWKNREGGTGPDPHLPDKIDWDKQVNSNVKALTKTGVSYNPATQEVTWKFDVNRFGAGLKNVTIEDVLDNVYDQSSLDGLTIYMRKYSQETMTEVQGEKLTKADSNDVLEKNQFTITKNDQGKDVIKIHLGDLVSDTATYYCVLDFKLKLTDPVYLAKQSDDQIAVNNATIKATLNNKEFTDNAEGKIKVPNRLIDKAAVGRYDYQSHKLTWQIEINPNKLLIEDAVITDTLPEDITWSGITDIKKNGTSLSEEEQTALIEEPQTTDRETKIKFKSSISDTYTFTFESEVTANWRDTNREELVQHGYVNVENIAKLDGKIYGTAITNAEDTATHIINHVKVGKSGVYNKEEGTITWTVLLNVDQINIKNMYLVENLKEAVHELDVDTIKVETVEIDKDGKISDKGTEVSAPDLRKLNTDGTAGEHGKEPDRRGFAFYLPTDKVDYSTYRITFTTDLLAGAAKASIENSVYLKTADDNYRDESGSSEGGYDGSFDAKDFVTKNTRPKITMTKASSNSVNIEAEKEHLLLGDAKFTLTAYEFEAEKKTITLGSEVARYEKVRLTDESGKAFFLNIKAESSSGKPLIYKLEETEPPAGYEKVDNYYIIFASDSDKGYENCTQVKGQGNEIPLTKENYIVKKAKGDAADTTAMLTLKDKPADVSFTFGKEIANRVTYNAGSVNYTYEELTNVDDVVFQVKPIGYLAGLVEPKYISNDAAGTFTIRELDPGTYTLTEVKSPDKMTIGAQYTLEVAWNAATKQYVYTISGDGSHNTVLDTSNTPIIKNGYLLGNFSFTKKVKYADQATENGTNPNENAENLSGAEFKLTSTNIAGSPNTTFEKIVTSDSNGTVSFTDIPVGEYTLEESELSGYGKTASLKVEVKEVKDRDNKLAQNGNDIYYGKKVEVTYSAANGGNQSLITGDVYSNTAIKGTISFTKVTGKGTTGLTAFDNDSPLGGAVFGLYRRIGEQTADKPTYKETSDAAGKVKFENVEYGDYTLKEMSAPAGYEIMPEIQLNRQQYTVALNNANFTYTVGDTSVLSGYVKNDLKAHVIPLTKVDADGNPLAGKEFTVYRRNSQAIKINGEKLEITAAESIQTYYAYTPKSTGASDSNGKIALDKLPIGDYLLVEKTEDANLQEGSKKPAVHVSIGADSTVSVKMTQSFSAAKTGDSYDFSQEKVKPADWTVIKKENDSYPIVNHLKYAYIQMNKTIANVVDSTLTSTGQSLGGAKFCIYKGDDTVGEPYLTLTTDDNGQFSRNDDGTYTDADSGKKKHLFYGTYTIKEVDAPEGLHVNEKSVTFTIDDTCGHEGIVWIKTNTDGTLAASMVSKDGQADKAEKGFFGNTLIRGKFQLKKKALDGDENVLLQGAKFHVMDGDKTAAVLTEQGTTGIYILDEESSGTAATTTKKMYGHDIPYLLNVGGVGNTEYHLLAGTYTVKEITAPAGYETSTFTITIKKDGTLADVKITGGSGTAEIESPGNDSTVILKDKAISLSIDKRAETIDGTKLQGAEFSVTGIFADLDKPQTVSLDTANTGHLFKANEEYVLKETTAPYGYKTGADVTIKFNEKGELSLLNDNKNAAIGTQKNELIYVNQPFKITLKKVDADNTVKILPGAKFVLKGIFAETNGQLEQSEREIAVVTKEGELNLSQIQTIDNKEVHLGQGRTYDLTETEAPAGYSGLSKIRFMVKEDGTLTFAETEDIIGDKTNCITVKNHRISFKLQKRDAVDDSVILTATVILKDVTDLSKIEQREVPIHSETVTYGNTVNDLFLQQNHTYEIWEEEKGTPYGYITPSKALASFRIDSKGSIQLISSIEGEQGQTLTAFMTDKNNVSIFTIINERKTGTVTLLKQDGADETALNDVVFTLYQKKEGNIFENIFNFLTGKTYSKVSETTWSDQADIAGKLTISGLKWGEYYIEETSPLPGYKADDAKYEFTIGKNQSYVMLSVDLGVIKNGCTEIRFHKAGLYNESCADASLGAPPSNAVQPLEGITFTAFSDADAAESSKAAEAVSDANGEVVFKKLTNGTYYIKETALSEKAAAQNYKLDESIYKAVLDGSGRFTGLQTMDGKEVQNNTVVNDVNRTDIVIEKVDEKNPDRTLPGSTYGLFRGAAITRSNDEWVQIAQATTDEKGILRFPGILMNVEYQIRELAAPDGSYVSANPLSITFAMDNGTVIVKSFDDGSGTTTVDPVTGKIVWKEPQVQAEFAKKDEDGNLLAGAKLEVWDENGTVIESWTSSADEPYLSYGTLIIGKTYKLVETEAPDGYEIAEPIEFTIPNESVGPNENKTIQIEMIDKKSPVKPATADPIDPADPADKINQTDSTVKKTTAAKIAHAVKTGDFPDIWGYLVLMAAAAIAAGVIYKKKR